MKVKNIGSILGDTARRFPNEIGVVRGEDVYTWTDLSQSADALSTALLGFGIGPGDVVFVQCSNDRYAFEMMFAIAKIGGVYAPVNFRASEYEVCQLVKLCKPKAYVCDAAFSSKIEKSVRESGCVKSVIWTNGSENWDFCDNYEYDSLAAKFLGVPVGSVDVEFADPWRIAFTSGTTGVPKGAINSHGQIGFTLLNRLADVMVGVDETHAHLAIGPLSHGTGTVALINTLKGAKIVMLGTAKFDEPEAWQLVEKWKITSLFTVPTILMRLIRHPSLSTVDWSSLQHVIYAGAAISRPDQIEAIEVFGQSLTQYYGSAECLGGGTVLPGNLHVLQDGAPGFPEGVIGHPRSCGDLAIVDENFDVVADGVSGEICLRGPGVFPGYYANEKANAECFKDDWYRTGDLGRIDEFGLVHLVGRIKDMFKSGGLQVYPTEIQNHLMMIEGVQEAYVVSVLDSKWGEIGIGIVKLEDTVSISEDTMRRQLRERLSVYKIPKRIFVWSNIPRNANGKVAKPMLLDLLYANKDIEENVDVISQKLESVS